MYLGRGHHWSSEFVPFLGKDLIVISEGSTLMMSYPLRYSRKKH